MADIIFEKVCREKKEKISEIVYDYRKEFKVSCFKGTYSLLNRNK